MAKPKPFRIVLRPPDSLRNPRDPNQLRGAMSNYLPPGAQYDYKPKSVFAEYKWVTVIFAVLLLGALIFWALAPVHDTRRVPRADPASAAAPSSDAVYVQPLSKP